MKKTHFRVRFRFLYGVIVKLQICQARLFLLLRIAYFAKQFITVAISSEKHDERSFISLGAYAISLFMQT